MLCVLILYISGGTYSLKSTPNDKFFEKLFMAILFTLRVFARNLLRGNRRRNSFRISFWNLAWDSNPVFSSNKPTHYLLDHGDFRNYTLHKYWSSNPWKKSDVCIGFIRMSYEVHKNYHMNFRFPSFGWRNGNRWIHIAFTIR